MKNNLGTTCGVWGDIIVNLGYFLDRVKEGNIIYLGNNDQIVEFLKCQPFINDVFKIQMDEKEWHTYWLQTVFPDPFKEPKKIIKSEDPFIEAGYKNFTLTHLTKKDTSPSSPIYQWQGVKLPKHVTEWAKEKAASLPKEFYLFQPYSFNSNNPYDHWRSWDRLAHFLTKRTNFNFVLIGHNWIPEVEINSRNMHDGKFISLYNEAPSMLHVYALARHATGVITTSNSLAHWCQVDNLPCVVICNRKSSRPNYLYRRVLDWPTVHLVDFEDEVEIAYTKICNELFSLGSNSI